MITHGAQFEAKLELIPTAPRSRAIVPKIRML